MMIAASGVAEEEQAEIPIARATSTHPLTQMLLPDSHSDIARPIDNDTDESKISTSGKPKKWNVVAKYGNLADAKKYATKMDFRGENFAYAFLHRSASKNQATFTYGCSVHKNCPNVRRIKETHEDGLCYVYECGEHSTEWSEDANGIHPLVRREVDSMCRAGAKPKQIVAEIEYQMTKADPTIEVTRYVNVEQVRNRSKLIKKAGKAKVTPDANEWDHLHQKIRRLRSGEKRKLGSDAGVEGRMRLPKVHREPDDYRFQTLVTNSHGRGVVGPMVSR